MNNKLVAMALASTLMAAACASAPRPAAKRVAAAPKTTALREFDGGLRALNLGGPEANEQAEARFAKATELDPQMWEAWHDLGLVRMRRGDDRGAIAALGKALAIRPQHTPSRLARAEAARRARAFDDARADYQAVLKENPDDNSTRLRLASLLRQSGNIDGSLAAVREVLRRSNANPDAYVELGLVYLAAGHEDLAELVLSKAAAADAKNARVWNALALVALHQGKDQDAFQRLDRATELDAKARDARFNKAAVLLDAGDYGRALAELTAAVKGDESPDLDALVALGVAYRGTGAYNEARATWERVLKAAPRQPDALFDLGVLEMDFLKDEAAARATLTRYLDAAPSDHPRRKEAQARLAELAPTRPASQPATRP